MRSLGVFFGLSLLYLCILLGHIPYTCSKSLLESDFSRKSEKSILSTHESVRQVIKLLKKCKIICLPTVHLGVLCCSQLVETCLCIPDQIGFLKVLVFKEKWKLEHPEKNLSEKERERTSNKLNPYGIDARIRTQATLVGGEWSPLPPKYFWHSCKMAARNAKRSILTIPWENRRLWTVYLTTAPPLLLKLTTKSQDCYL